MNSQLKCLTSSHNVSGGTLIFSSTDAYGSEYFFGFDFAPSRKEISKLRYFHLLFEYEGLKQPLSAMSREDVVTKNHN